MSPGIKGGLKKSPGSQSVNKALSRLTRVYHVSYEPSYNSANIHLWTDCNLKCRGCYANYEKHDFGLIDDAVEKVANQTALVEPPDKFLTIEELLERLKGLKLEFVGFIGTEPSLDPALPEMAKALKDKFGCYNILLTNGMKLTDMEHIDQVVFSLKAFTEELHIDYTGHSNKKVLSNFVKLKEMNLNFHAETVLIPGYIDCDEVERLARFVASVDPKMSFRIDSYFRVPSEPWPNATKEQVEKAAELARKHLEKVVCLTLDMKRIGEKAKWIF